MAEWLDKAWIDVSVPVHNGMVHWPGDPPYHIQHVHDQKKGDVCTVSRVGMGVHTGTHMDAPRHFIEGAATIDEMPLDATLGPARVIQIRDKKSIHREELLEYQIENNERVLFKTGNSDHLWNKDEFDEDFIFIARDGAEYLAECGVRSVGVDYLSVGGLSRGRRRDSPDAAWRGHLDYRGAEPERRRTRPVRIDLPAAETDRFGRRAGTGDS
jgi:arylformamidase